MRQTVRLFDKFRILLPSGLRQETDGKRVAFSAEHLVISFEEGMQMLDMRSTQGNALCFQCCKDGKYLHLRREEDSSHAFFHLEFEDAEGGTVYLPGQMTADAEYRWSDGIEPILMELFEGITLEIKEEIP